MLTDWVPAGQTAGQHWAARQDGRRIEEDSPRNGKRLGTLVSTREGRGGEVLARGTSPLVLGGRRSCCWLAGCGSAFWDGMGIWDLGTP